MPVPVLLIFIGVLCYLVGHIALLVAAFKESIVWGLCVLFVPFAGLVFIIKYWEAAKQPFLCSIVGGVLMGAGFVMGRDELIKHKEFANFYAQLEKIQKAREAAAPPQQKEETPEEKHNRIKAEFLKDAADLKTKYDALQVQWASVSKSGDKVARAAFDKDAAAYAELRKKVEAEKAEAEAPIPSTTSAPH